MGEICDSLEKLFERGEPVIIMGAKARSQDSLVVSNWTSSLESTPSSIEKQEAGKIGGDVCPHCRVFEAETVTPRPASLSPTNAEAFIVREPEPEPTLASKPTNRSHKRRKVLKIMLTTALTVLCIFILYKLKKRGFRLLKLSYRAA